MSTATETFSLRALIREVASESASADPGVIAKEVERRVPDEHVRDAMHEMLRAYVRDVTTAGRTYGLGQVAAKSAAAPSPASGRSSKVKAIREAWRSMLRESIHVGPAASDWKFLADCTHGELLFAAGERRDLASRNVAMAERLERLASVLERSGVATVGDLPESDLRDNLGGAK